jgi:hypothetical protein
MHLNFFTQTLTNLRLDDNDIGDEGAQYLADAFADSTVNILFCSFLSFIFSLFLADAHRTQS